MWLRNDFTEETKSLFVFVKNCMRCKMSGNGLQGDHIMGRVSNSPYNFSPLCPSCHFLKARAGHKGKLEQLRWTKEFLEREGYEPDKKDLLFLKEI